MSIEFGFTLYLSNDFLELFHKHKYEKYLLDIMNESKVVFPNDYEMVQEQSNGECDFIDCKTNEKFDAKIPFESKHMKMLAKGKKYNPDVRGWIEILRIEANEYAEGLIEEKSISELKLYNIIKKQVEKEKEDESIIFFLPYPISIDIEGSIFAQFFPNYFDAIGCQLKKDIDLKGRSIYAIYPSAEENKFVLRQIDSQKIEFIVCEELGDYFYSKLDI